MLSRDTVYEVVFATADDLEQHYKDWCITQGEEFIALFNWRTEDFLPMIYHQTGLLLTTQPTSQRLSHIKNVAGLCVLAMMHGGGCGRDVNTGNSTNFLEPSLTRGKVQMLINTERQYQDELGSGRTDGRSHNISGFMVMLTYYVERAFKQWVTSPGDEYALNEIRKIAAICVLCLELHGG